MKKIILIILFLSIINLGNAQSVSLPAATITPAPLESVENNGTGVGGFTFAESSGVDVPASAFGMPNVTVSVNLQYIELTAADVNGITGTLLDHFTVTYDQGNNKITFEQNSIIPGDWFASVNFPITVVQNSTQAEAYNGFNANIAAIDGSTNAQGNASVFTYTIAILPDAVDDAVTTNEDTPVVVPIYDNDANIPTDGTLVTTNPANGTVVVTDPNNTPNDPSDDVVTYTPNPNFNGTDTFDYTVCDTANPQNCDTATVTVTVDPVVDLPVANNDDTTTDEDTAVTFNATGNDTDDDGTIDTATVDLDPSTPAIDNTFTSPEGDWSVAANGDVTFTPNADFNGTATIPYTVNDNEGNLSNQANLTVVVAPIVDVVDDVATTNEDTPVVVDIYDNDNDIPTDGTLTVTNPANGTVVVTDPNNTPNDPSDDVVTYTPNPNFNGTDTFDYTVCDTANPQNCETATVTITVDPVVDVVDDVETTSEDTPVVVAIYDNDNDIPTDGTLVITNPANGTVVVTDPNNTPNDPSDDVVTYTPNQNFSGVDTFDYTVCDTSVPQNCDTATVTVTILPVPDFKPTIFTGNTTIIGAIGVVDFRVLVGEFANGNSNGVTNVELRIIKNAELTISFDNALTSLNGQPVSNNQWQYDGSHPSLHRFTYIGNGGIFNANTPQFLGINATYNPPANTKGAFPLKTTVKYFSGGEKNNANNDDIDYIEYNNNN